MKNRESFHLESVNVSEEEYISKKLTQKLVQQLQDPLVVSARALPDWCDYLM